MARCHAGVVLRRRRRHLARRQDEFSDVAGVRRRVGPYPGRRPVRVRSRVSASRTSRSTAAMAARRRSKRATPTDTAPGLLADPTYLRLTMSGGIDSRPSAGYARRGGLYALTYDAFGDQDGAYSFELLQAEIIQHLPILRENWVFSIHGVAKTTVDDASTVPFFLLPVAGQRQHAARLSQLALPRSSQHPGLRRVSLDSERVVPRPRDLLRRGQGRERPRRSQLCATHARLGPGPALSWSDLDPAAPRHRSRARGIQSRDLGRGGVLNAGSA